MNALGRAGAELGDNGGLLPRPKGNKRSLAYIRRLVSQRPLPTDNSGSLAKSQKVALAMPKSEELDRNVIYSIDLAG